MLVTIMTYLQIILSILLSLAILTQNRSAGLSATFGGSGGFHSSKRGVDKVLANVTVVLAVAFAFNSLAFLFV